MEKRTRWILGSSPLGLKKIFLGKLFFFVVSFIILGSIMGYTSIVALNINLDRTLYLLILFLSTITSIVTFGLTLGARYPSFETDDPDVISTSMPGLFFTGISLLYSALSAYVLYLTITGNTLVFLLIHVFLAAAVTSLLIRFALMSNNTHYTDYAN
jgi:hypothetical protein